MSESKKKNNFLSILQVFNESLLRDLILFFLAFIFVISQEWDTIFLILFPIITFSFALFFKIISTNKWRTQFKTRSIIYNPLGLEKKNANRLNFSALVQLMLLFWIGAESLYHPQLIDDYQQYFMIIFCFVYTFGFYWPFIDLWKFTRISINIGDNDVEIQQEDSAQYEDLKLAVSILKLDYYKKIFMFVLLNFIILNILNVLFAFLIIYQVLPGISFNLPGTGIEGSHPFLISHVIYGILVSPPIITTFFLRTNYQIIIQNFDKDRLKQLLEPLPKNIQIKIIENLKAIAVTKIAKELKYE